MHEIGCFVSSHGFGHATRTAAVVEALAEKTPLHAHIFATAGEELFRQSLERFTYHHLLTDLGFVQHDAFDIDIAATRDELAKLLPYSPAGIDRLAGICRSCSCIICDISGMGIEVAQRLGIPAVLIENFTWDFIYAPYFRKSRRLEELSGYLEHVYARADIHIQTDPVCRPGKADLHCGPIARSIRSSRAATRSRLNHDGRIVVLVSLGGIPYFPQFLTELEGHPDMFFLLTGQQKSERVAENVEFIGRASSPYHPDLMGGADIAVFKCGYSTMAECWQAGTPAICIRRQGFAESASLEKFARNRLGATLISQDDFNSGKWLDLLAKIPLKRRIPPAVDGAEQVADFLCERVFTGRLVRRDTP